MLASAPAIINDTPASSVSSFHGLAYSIRSEDIRFLSAQEMGQISFRWANGFVVCPAYSR